MVRTGWRERGSFLMTAVGQNLPQQTRAVDDRGVPSMSGTPGTAPETRLLALVRSVHPELAIIDIRMPPTHGTEGLRAARVIRDELPRTAIIVAPARWPTGRKVAGPDDPRLSVPPSLRRAANSATG
jgi:CheY-like chemotaxis protein